MMMRSLSCSLLLLSVGCVERVPSELKPVADAITDLPANFCGTTSNFDFSLKNIGDDEIVLSAVTIGNIAPNDGSFHDAIFADNNIPAGEVGFVQFSYETPDGVAQSAQLTITSNAAVNPELVIELSTVAFPPPDNAAEICAR
jgi:hypothetical protein